jgi:hypothetical protein
MRFAPPRISLPAELTWLLGAAFGPDLPAIHGEPDSASRLAAQFDLGPRIVARHGAKELQERLGPAANEMIRAHRRAVAVALVAERTARQVAVLAAGRRLPIVFLKGFALQLVAPGPAGWRPFVDLDVLLSREDAAVLRQLLVADGWVAEGEADNPQHLPPVGSPEGTPVDIHFRLRGVRVGDTRWALAEELLAADLCLAAPGLPDGAWVPRPPLLAAHLAVHALEQHGHRPATYPLLRAVADIADLGAEIGDGAVTTVAGRFVGETITEEELGALCTLGRVLAAGRTPVAEGDDERSAAMLLRHIVAGVLDPVYRQGLAIDHTAGRLRQARRDGQLMRYIARKLKAPGDPPEAASGRSPRGLEFVGRRLLHPLHLAARLASSAAARLRRPFDR